MKKFDEQNASSEELFEWCLKEYDSNNIVTKMLISRFYKKIRLIIEEIKPNIKKILEIGCGAGESSLRIIKMIPEIQYDATEYDMRYIEEIKKRNIPLNVCQENVYEIKHADNSYDCIIMLEVLEHLEYIEKAITELFRVSRKYIIISVPNEPIWRISNFLRGKYLLNLGNTPGHINHFNEKKLKKIILPFTKKITFYKSFPWIILLAEKDEKKVN